MGNEKSAPSGIKIEEIIKITDDWIQKSATFLKDDKKICVFEQCLCEKNAHVLQLFSKNLKLYRHPYILKYISSWRTSKCLYVATEYAKPLAQVIEDLKPLQLCIGLYNVVKAIIFLQEKAFSSHNNLSTEAIYVTCEGHWKLGRLELMSSKIRLNQGNNLEKIDPRKSTYPMDFRDQRGFATLALEILNTIITNDEIPGVTEFKEFCSLHVSSDNSNPYFFHQLLLQPFFNHQFVNIFNFLIELPIKNETEKSDFLKSLADELMSFPEELVARQLGTLLLSRLVLLNKVAQDFLLPKMFTPKSDHYQSLFSKAVLQKCISPRLLHLFSLRDSQIRLILLRYFSSFYTIFSTEELETRILPELLVGIKDTNELLVAATLHTLADLVPVLGAAVVIGKGRVKLFADGRPMMNKEKPYEKFIGSDLHSELETSVINAYVLAERPSPDGGEDLNEIVNVNQKEDVTVNNEKFNFENIHHHNLCEISSVPYLSTFSNDTKVMPLINQNMKRELVNHSLNTVNEDLSSLDVKCSRNKHDSKFDDIDLIFKAMEPVILKTETIELTNENETVTKRNSKFEAVDVELENFDGWGDEITNWSDVEEIVG